MSTITNVTITPGVSFQEFRERFRSILGERTSPCAGQQEQQFQFNLGALELIYETIVAAYQFDANVKATVKALADAVTSEKQVQGVVNDATLACFEELDRTLDEEFTDLETGLDEVTAQSAANAYNIDALRQEVKHNFGRLHEATRRGFAATDTSFSAVADRVTSLQEELLEEIELTDEAADELKARVEKLENQNFIQGVALAELEKQLQKAFEAIEQLRNDTGTGFALALAAQTEARENFLKLAGSVSDGFGKVEQDIDSVRAKPVLKNALRVLITPPPAPIVGEVVTSEKAIAHMKKDETVVYETSVGGMLRYRFSPDAERFEFLMGGVWVDSYDMNVEDATKTQTSSFTRVA